MIYTVRRGLFSKPVAWRLEDGVLIESREGAEKSWPLSDLRGVRLVSGANRYMPNARMLALRFRKGGVRISSHGFLGVARYVDQTQAFNAVVRAICAQAAAYAPSASFEGGPRKGSGAFAGAAAILGMGVLLLLIGAMAARQAALGAELAARFGFILLLMFAAAPWLPGAQARRFDPHAVPDDLLP